MQNRGKKKIAPIVVTILVVIYLGPIVALTLAAVTGLAGTDAGAVIPFLLLYGLVGGAVIVGVFCAMAQRLREIDGGEEDEARKY